MKVPNDDNGAGCMYLKGKTLCVKNKRGDIYQYESGNLRNKILMKDQLAKVYDKNGKTIMQPDNLKILCSSPMRSVMIFFLYEIAILLISKIYFFVRKSKL